MTTDQDLELSPSQQKNLDELKRRMDKVEMPPHFDKTITCYRFLKAQNFDVGEAEKALTKSLDWRRQNRIDFIETEYDAPEVLKDYFANMILGHDKTGVPFVYGQCGHYDLRGLHLAAKYVEIEKSMLSVCIEKMNRVLEERSKVLNKVLKGGIFIYDMEGFSLANATSKKALESSIRFMKMLQDNYPERVKTIYMVNAASYFTLFYSLLKNFLSPGILNKIQIFGTEGWQEEILKYIDEDQLPVFLGGTRTDPDGNPRCLTLINTGGKIDEKYYVHRSTRALSDHPDAKTLVLSRASFSEIVLDVVEAGSCIEYEFETRTRDIGFGLFYRETTEGGTEHMKELVALQRMDTADFAETGIYKCDKAGQYVILFDNSYSWVRAKEIYYLVKVKSPDEVEKALEHCNGIH